MSTISAMSRNNYTMLKYAQEKGVSLFDGSATNLSTDYGYSSSSKKTNSTSSGMWSNSSIWDTYNSSNVSSAASTAEGLVGIRSSLAEMTSSYKNAASTFKTEHKSTMSDLKDASSAIKNMDFNVGGEDAVTKTENADGTTTVTKSTKLKDALKSIENFVDKYNDAIEFFDDNADVSNRIKNMGKTFADTTYNSDLLSSIGVNVGKDGTKKIDEDKLTGTKFPAFWAKTVWRAKPTIMFRLQIRKPIVCSRRCRRV